MAKSRTEPKEGILPSNNRDEAPESGTGWLLPGMTKEYSGWDVYNNEARKVDTELVNDWRDSLNSLLLFAAIFAAVLTAFIIESKKRLEEDPTGIMVDVMIFYTNNVANGTHTPYTRPQFQPTSADITVNCLFFASLSTSLVAALASVVALQWVADYDAAITRGGSSPEDRAKRRQFRYAGVVWWKMSEIIAALPLLLYCSVVLFFSGLILWMWVVNHIIGLVVAGGAALVVLFYGISTLLAVTFVSAPFRTPLARWIYSLSHFIFSATDLLSVALHVPLIPAWLKNRHLPYTGSRKREDNEVDKRGDMGVKAVVWLANQLSISQDSYDRLLLLASELPKLEREISSFPSFQDAPWAMIFDLLGWKNLKNSQLQTISQQDMQAFTALAQCYRIPTIYEIIQPDISMLYSPEEGADEYWLQYCDVKSNQWSPKEHLTTPNSLFLLLRDVPLPSGINENEIKVTIWLSRWRNSVHNSRKAPNEVADAQTDATSLGGSFVNVNRFLQKDEKPVWLLRDDETLFTTCVGRAVMQLVMDEGTISPIFLDLLRWRFEIILIGDKINPDATLCLSTPLDYRRDLQDSRHVHLHYNFTLLLARNLGSCSGSERIRRVKEVITMMWVANSYSTGLQLDKRGGQPWGMEQFFDANKDALVRWIIYSETIPYIHEILHHLAAAQADQPEIGPLWRVTDPQMDTDPHFLDALQAFDYLTRQNITPAQHCSLVDLICRDIELGPPGTFRGYFTIGRLRDLSSLRDPCLRVLANVIARRDVEDFYMPPIGAQTLHKDSWARIASHTIKHYTRADLEFLLPFQARLWPAFSESEDLYARALQDPKVFDHLQRIFQHPMQCPAHSNNEGHLLLHLLPKEVFGRPKLSSNISMMPSIQIQGYPIEALLAMLIQTDEHEGMLPLFAERYMHQQCLELILGLLKDIKASQYSLLELLSDTMAHLVRKGESVWFGELTAMSVCIHMALNLPTDPRMSFIGPLVVENALLARDEHLRLGSKWGFGVSEAIVTADNTVDRLKTFLASMLISGGQNRCLLACARTEICCTPAIGWLPAYID